MSSDDREPLDVLLELEKTSPWSWQDLDTSTLPPKQPGVYAWCFSKDLPLVPLQGTTTGPAGHLLYVGIAGSNLRGRIKGQHYRGNAEGSSLRRRLGLLLAEKLDLRLQYSKSGKTLTYGRDGEARLTAWMAAHAHVGWVACSAPREVELEALKRLVLPLNVADNTSEFHGCLNDIRSRMIATAKAERLHVDS